MNYKEIAKHYITKIIPSPSFSSAGMCGDPNLLYPSFKVKVEDMLSEYEKYNEDHDVPYILESFRSHALQRAYYFRGASKIRGGSIMNAGMHHFGIAVDLVNLRDENNNGVRDINEAVDWNSLDYTLLHKLANTVNVTYLKWEACHFQAIQVLEQEALRNEVHYEVIRWQKANGLAPDGIVGPKTIAKAKELYL